MPKASRTRSPTTSGSRSSTSAWSSATRTVLGQRDPPYLNDKVIGLISAAGGTQRLQAINTMEFAVRALRGWAVPYVVPVASAARVFDSEGRIRDQAIELQLKTLGSEVVRVAERFATDEAVHRQAEMRPRRRAGRDRVRRSHCRMRMAVSRTPPRAFTLPRFRRGGSGYSIPCARARRPVRPACTRPLRPPERFLTYLAMQQATTTATSSH